MLFTSPGAARGGGGGLKCGLKCNGSLGCEQVYTDVIVFVGNNRALKDLHFV